jgi:hypothetical protein
MLKLRKRRAQALDYREAGRSFRDIAREMNVNVATAHDYVVRAIAEVVPRETAQEVLAAELSRLDKVMAVIWPNACTGDEGAIRTYLRIMRERCKLMGLYPNERGGIINNVNIGGNSGADARTTGIQVTFIDAPPRDDLPPPIDVTPRALPAPGYEPPVPSSTAAPSRSAVPPLPKPARQPVTASSHHRPSQVIPESPFTRPIRSWMR